MKTPMSMVLSAALVLLLSACATGPAEVTGAYKAGPSYQVTLGRTWADFSNMMVPRVKGVHMLTVDGPLLNRLYVTEGLAPGGYIVKPANKERPTPTYRAGMSPNELVEFVTDTVAALGYQSPETAAVRPANFGAAPGVRFDIKTRTVDGLDISGAAQVAEAGGKLYVMLYLAPSEHYYAANLAEVEAAFASATLSP